MKSLKCLMILAALAANTSLAAANAEDVFVEHLSAPDDKLRDSELEKVLAEAQNRMEAGREQLARAKAHADAQKEMLLAQARSVGTAKATSQRLAAIVRRGGSGANRTLVIPRDANDARDFAEIEEDLNVMAHILDKAAGSDDQADQAMGIAVFGRFPGSGASPRNLYLEGHGAVFLLDVNYPLLPPPAARGTTEVKEETSGEWEEARRELSQPATTGLPDPYLMLGHGFRGEAGVWHGRSALEYDAGKVDNLKQALLTALKNAAHIRRLKPDETVTVVVTAPGSISTPNVKRSGGGYRGGSGIGTSDAIVVEEVIAPESATPAPASRLVLRVRKSDAEAFKNGKLSFDEFRKQAAVMLY